MSSSSRAQHKLGVLLYMAGVLLALALGTLATWGDLEASLFDPSEQAQESLTSLRCPVLITRREIGRVWARFKNTGPRPVDRAVRAHISQGFVTLFREENVKLPLQPGESRRWYWEVTAADAAFGSSLVLVRVSTLRQSPLPSQSRACGIVVLNIPWPRGSVVIAGWLTLALGSLAGGIWLWWQANRPLAGRRRTMGTTMGVVGLIVLAILIAGLAGWWLVSVLLLALLVLLLISLFAHALLQQL